MKHIYIGGTGCNFKDKYEDHVASFNIGPNWNEDKDRDKDKTRINIKNKEGNTTALWDWVRELCKNKIEFELVNSG